MKETEENKSKGIQYFACELLKKKARHPGWRETPYIYIPRNVDIENLIGKQCLFTIRPLDHGDSNSNNNQIVLNFEGMDSEKVLHLLAQANPSLNVNQSKPMIISGD